MSNKKTFILTFFSIVFFLCFIVYTALPLIRTEREVIIPEPVIIYETINLTPIEIERVQTDDRILLKQLINEMENRKENASTAIDCVLALGYSKDHQIFTLLRAEWENADSLSKVYKAHLNEINENIKWDTRMTEYPEATTIWLYLKGLGYNNYICAGIVGNIMAEVGGCTLKIQPGLYSSDKYYYGMCQWCWDFFPEIFGKDLSAQCEFLRCTIEEQINSFNAACNYKYYSYEDFTQITDAREAALVFAKAYERCASFGYWPRQNCADVAYNYFAN